MAERQDIMLCYQYSESRLLKQYNKPWIIQPKLEGDRCRALGTPHGWRLVSSSGKPRNMLPHINRDLDQWKPLTLNEMDGELYHHGWPHERIRSVVSRTQWMHEDHESIEYWVYDLINEYPQLERLKMLDRQFEELKYKHLVKTSWIEVDDLSDLYSIYEDTVSVGYEGIIIRDPKAPYQRKRTTTMMKLKPRMTGYFLCIDLVEEIDIYDNPKDRLGAVVLMDKEQNVFNVGTGFNAAQRELYWNAPEEIVGKVIKIQYQSLTEDRGVPKMSSFKDVLEE